MTPQPDNWIKQKAIYQRMIDPFCPGQSPAGVISYGLSSYGYDIRVSDEYKIFTNTLSAVVDPKHFDARSMVDWKGDICTIPPNSFVLARSLEYMRIPEDVIALCLGKSTYARCGIVLNTTPLEPGWEGIITLEISNTTPLPALIYSGEGIAQVIFFLCDPCDVSYSARKGKYQQQQGITLPKV